jgi:hypothetical protein
MGFGEVADGVDETDKCSCTVWRRLVIAGPCVNH